MIKQTLVALLLSVGAGVVQAQTCTVELAGGKVVDAAHYRLAYRMQPEKVVIGRHFSMEVAVCAKAGGAIEGIQVDAFMPEHRHGMNYRPVAKSLGGDRYQIDGLMFHMPGRWDLYFDVKGGGRTERLTQENVLR